MSALSRFAHDVEDLRTDATTTDPLAHVDGPLRRFLRPRRPTGETCELCAEPVGADHRHVVDLERRGILCTCRGCGLLFEQRGAGRYRTVPDRSLRLEPFSLSPVVWASLQIPVGVAFVVHNSQLQRPVAFYPSPAGATESELTLRSWDELVTDNPVLADVVPDVEAVAIRNDTTATACYIVPVDRCYELVGRLRLTWRGFDGGRDAAEALASFFGDLDATARAVAGGRA